MRSSSSTGLRAAACRRGPAFALAAMLAVLAPASDAPASNAPASNAPASNAPASEAPARDEPTAGPSPAGARVQAVPAGGPSPDGALAHRDDLTSQERARVASVMRPAEDFTRAEPFERMPGGATTVGKLVNADIFSHPSANLDFAGRERFFVGNGLFRKDWVPSPSSTLASDGLGPLFNARSCQACHVKDGRADGPGNFPEIERPAAVGMLIRLSVPPTTDAERARLAAGALVVPDPVYGGQLQDFAMVGLPAEGRIAIRYEEVPVALAGGEVATLRKPSYRIEDPGYGPLRADLMLSPRLAPPMLGMGLLEAIHPGDILANAGRRDEPDGVVGKANWVPELATGRMALGRFGWKAGQPSVRQQVASAFADDMGLSTPLIPRHAGDCTPAQVECLDKPHGAQPQLGEHEVPGRLADFVDDYSSHIALPQRRALDDVRVLAGKSLFYQARCTACHVPKFVTRRDAARPELAFQLIWPYSDLLLHDMGEGLADHRPEGLANGREWRTPPLWGIGLTAVVNPRATYLHDGRARNLLEAILWHGGEAQAARERVVAMSPQERADLIRFLESL